MNKISTILLMLLFVAVQAIAGPVSKEEALLKAKAFMADRGMNVVSVNLARKAPSKVSGVNVDAESAAYYVFNAGSNTSKGPNPSGGGFVIVSGDDRTIPILGYSDSGTFCEENMPDNLKAWLEGYAEQIAALEAGAQPARVPSVGTAISTMLTTTWNQMEPYNNNCPEYSSGNKSATGCTATATAQIMNYHEKPITSAAIPGYTTFRYQLTLSELEAKTFDWANMLNSYSGTYTDEQATAVAELMRYVGQSMEMDYGPESGSATTKAIQGLIKYLGYDQNARYAARKDYSIQEWHSLIYTELQNGRPVLYGGQSSGGGHSFVIDGYDGASLFHVNWGWGGSCDGNFALEVLNPYSSEGVGASTSSGGYSFAQDCAVGLQPATEATAEPSYLSSYGFFVNGMTLTCNVINFTMNATDFMVGWAILKDDNTIGDIIGGLTRIQDLPLSYYTEFPKDFSDYALASGATLKVVPVSCEYSVYETGTPVWKNCLDAGRYALLTGGSDGTVASIEIFPKTPFSVTSCTIPENIVAGTACSIPVNLQNSSNEINGELWFVATTTSNGVSSKVEEIEGLYLEQSATGTVTFSVSFPQTGTYSYVIYYSDPNGAINNATLLKSGTLSVTSDFSGNISCSYNAGTLTGNIEFTNNSTDAYNSGIYVSVYEQLVEGGSFDYQVSGEVDDSSVSTGGSTTAPFSLSSLSEGSQYYFALQYVSDERQLITIGASNIVAVPITVSVTDAGYATFCNANRSLDFSAATNIKAYKVTVSGSKAILTEVKKVNKGQGVILRSSGAASEAIPLLTDGTTDATTNLMVGLTAGETIYETATVGSDTYTNYVLANKDGKIAFYKPAASFGTNMTAGKAYLRVPVASAASYFSLDGDDDGTTGISDAVNAPAADNAFYTLQGIRVDAPTKGLYIHRGRVVLVK